NADPSKKDFKVPDLLPPSEIGEARLQRRRDLRAVVDDTVKDFDASQSAQLMDTSFSSAYRLMTSVKAREAFDLMKEPEKVRERYGLTRFGQSCLLARRLVEAGVRFVTINTFITVFDEITWDIHGSKPFTSIAGMKDLVAPMYDQGYSALIEDLAQRGMLGNTLVCNLAEFGRTPKINPAGGRDHWPQCWTVYFAGGGVKGGRVVGKSDEIGAYPAERPVSPAEIVATIYHSLGLNLTTELPGPNGRPFPLVNYGTQPVRDRTFRNHVQPVLAKLGGSSGACHGAPAGQNGFKLSLRGYDDEGDYLALTRNALGRRIVPSDPGRSLLLLKPTGAVPHKGGKRFDVGSLEYRVLAEWIAAGTPGPKPDDPRIDHLQILPEHAVLTPGANQQLLVRAHFSDGHAEDVTRWAKYTAANASVTQVDDDGKVQVVGNGEGAITAWYLSRIAIGTITVPYTNTIAPSVFARAP